MTTQDKAWARVLEARSRLFIAHSPQQIMYAELGHDEAVRAYAAAAVEAALADTLGLLEGLLTSGAATQVDLYLGDCPGVQQITVDRLEDGTFRYWKARADQLQDDGTPCTRDEAQALLAGEEKKG